MKRLGILATLSVLVVLAAGYLEVKAQSAWVQEYE
jgi:hypothetical protein